jgi:hypothetical protein
MSLRTKLKQLKRKDHGLSVHERQDMADELSAYMDLYPVREGRIARTTGWSSFPRFGAVGIAAMVLVTMTISESSLPTDSLYGVKTNVNERLLRAATYFSPALRAEAERTVYARRLSEAEQLMLLSQFNAATASKMQTSIEAHETALDESLARAAATGDTEEATELITEVVATKEKYDPVLDILELRKRVPDPSVVDDVIHEVTKEYAGAVKTDAVPDVFARIKDEVMRTYATRVLDNLTAIDKTIASSTRTNTSLTPDVAALLETSNEERAAAEAALAAHDHEAALTHLDLATSAARDALSALHDEPND